MKTLLVFVLLLLCTTAQSIPFGYHYTEVENYYANQNVTITWTEARINGELHYIADVQSDSTVLTLYFPISTGRLQTVAVTYLYQEEFDREVRVVRERCTSYRNGYRCLSSHYTPLPDHKMWVTIVPEQRVIIMSIKL